MYLFFFNYLLINKSMSLPKTTNVQNDMLMSLIKHNWRLHNWMILYIENWDYKTIDCLSSTIASLERKQLLIREEGKNNSIVNPVFFNELIEYFQKNNPNENFISEKQTTKQKIEQKIIIKNNSEDWYENYYEINKKDINQFIRFKFNNNESWNYKIQFI